jgi:predicted esterase YcpF (UPF0227 family)
MTEDGSLRTRLIYLHGFNSSPDSKKAQSLERYIKQQTSEASSAQRLEFLAPSLPYKPVEAIRLIEGLLADGEQKTILMGSSLGGYYSIYLAQQYPLKVILINPLVSLPPGFAEQFPGSYTNPYSGDEFEILPEDVDFLQDLEVKVIPDQIDYLLLAETGDEVLDYQQAVTKLPGAQQIILPGGSHRFENFDRVLPDIMQFAGL